MGWISILHVALHASQHPPTSNFRISAQRQSFQRFRLQTQNSALKLNVLPLLHTPTAHNLSPYLLHTRTLYLPTSLPEGQAGAFRAVNVSLCNNKRSASLYIPAYHHHHHHPLYARYLYLYSWDKLCPYGIQCCSCSVVTIHGAYIVSFSVETIVILC